MKKLINYSLVILSLAHSASVYANKALYTTEHYTEVLVAAVMGAKKQRTTLPDSIANLTHLVETHTHKPLSHLGESEIQRIIEGLSKDEQKQTYHSFARHEKKIVLEGLKQNFWDKSNTNLNLATYLDILAFLIMCGSGLEEMQPIVTKEAKVIEGFKTQKSMSLPFLMRFKSFSNTLERELPDHFKQEMTAILNPSPEELGVAANASDASKLAAVITVLSKKINPQKKSK